MSKTKFSILLPTHNRLSLLTFAIHSVLSQKYSNYELIVHDNNSTEDISSYIESLKNPSIKYIKSNSSLPVTESWNKTMALATGDYLIMLGDDDALIPGALEDLDSIISEHSPDYIYSAAIQYAYPGVIPDRPKPFIQKPFFPFKDKALGANLSKKVAHNIVKQSMQLRLPLGYNIQHSIISKELVSSLSRDNLFFHSPYPDYYATNLLFYSAQRIYVHDHPICIIGMSPKSFGFHYFNQQEEVGNQLLNNQPKDLPNYIEKNLLPGSQMNSSWYIAMELVKKHSSCPFPVSRANYRQLQYLESAFKSKAVPYKNKLSIKEKCYCQLFLDALDFMNNNTKDPTASSELLESTSPYPNYDLGVTSVESLNIIDLLASQELSKYIKTQSFFTKANNKPEVTDTILKRFLLPSVKCKIKFWEPSIISYSPKNESDTNSLTINFQIHGPADSIEFHVISTQTNERYSCKVNKKNSKDYNVSIDRNLPKGRYIINGVYKERYIHQSSFTYKPHYPGNYSLCPVKTTSDSSLKFSLLTTVYNTPFEYIDMLFESIKSQAHRNFEWLILDNGSTENGLREKLIELSKRDQRICLYRVDQNIHIIPGNRYLLERASGDYIVPLDADDLISRDSLSLASQSISERPECSVFYSDEQIIDKKNQPIRIIKRLEHTHYVTALNTCPFSHLSFYNRKKAIDYDLYSSDHANGSHDWDSALRFLEKEEKAWHIPHVLYSWRMLDTSTSKDSNAKPYILDSQYQNVIKTLERKSLGKKFHVSRKATGYYNIKRTSAFPTPVLVIFQLDSPLELGNLEHNLKITNYDEAIIYVALPDKIDRLTVKARIESVLLSKDVHFIQVQQLQPETFETSNTPYAAYLSSCKKIESPNWIWDSLSLFELSDEVKCVVERSEKAIGLISKQQKFTYHDEEFRALLEAPILLIKETETYFTKSSSSIGSCLFSKV